MIHASEPAQPVRTDGDLDPIHSQHAALRARAERLETQLDTLAHSGPEEADGGLVEETRSLLEAFRLLLRNHLDLEEREGVIEMAVAAAPRFGARAARLLEEHEELRVRIDGLARDAEGGPESGGWTVVHAGFVTFRRILLAHDRAETEVMQRAYLEDLGGGD